MHLFRPWLGSLPRTYTKRGEIFSRATIRPGSALETLVWGTEPQCRRGTQGVAAPGSNADAQQGWESDRVHC